MMAVPSRIALFQLSAVLRLVVGQAHLGDRHQVAHLHLGAHLREADVQAGVAQHALIVGEPDRRVVLILGLAVDRDVPLVELRQGRARHVLGAQRLAERKLGDHLVFELVLRAVLPARMDEPPVILPAGQALPQVFDQVDKLLARLLVLVVLPELPVVHDDDRLDQPACTLAAGLVDQLLGVAAVPEEAAGDQRQQAGAEQEAALPLEAGFAEDAFERAIRHEARPLWEGIPHFV